MFIPQLIINPARGGSQPLIWRVFLGISHFPAQIWMSWMTWKGTLSPTNPFPGVGYQGSLPMPNSTSQDEDPRSCNPLWGMSSMENLQENMDFTPNIVVSCKFSSNASHVSSIRTASSSVCDLSTCLECLTDDLLFWFSSFRIWLLWELSIISVCLRMSQILLRLCLMTGKI